ncbi:phospholipase A1 [Marinobacter daqiaonensis]|uniref:Phospholipase A1 n=1 Tax=Marinobacter daqiaonensis TaxID=650891 RepID=A0A1I6I3L8_9GAMM|nr:phospholipase A [Marinobacter daqiaonensis]SFR61010.1 phospholipase A1 [Marinobacter daqiaonensis]
MRSRILNTFFLTLLVLNGTALAQDQDQQKETSELARDLEDESNREVPESRAMEQELDEYEARERLMGRLIGGFVPYRPTYILPYTYVDDPNQNPNSPRVGEASYDSSLFNEEAKYQISFRVPLLSGILDDRTTLWFGYTQKSFWQVYNTDDSAPFRETNYEPEIFLRHRLGWDIGPGELNAVTAGFSHQSNGQSEPRSRSWNRIKGSVSYTYDRWLFIVSPWYRVPEDGGEDDNPDIDDYLGYADYLAVYKWDDNHVLSTRLMNNLRSDNRTSVEIGYSFPIGQTLKGFVQYYNGYGESLIDYNERIHRLGIGIMLNDWL